MRETLKVLRGLQELDQDLYRVRDELKRLPGEKDKRRAQLDLENERLAALDQKVHEVKTRIKEIEDLTTMQRQRIRKLENEAGDSRADVALHVAFQHEIRSLKREISQAEEEGIGLVEEVETIQAERERLSAAIEGAQGEFDEYAGNVDRELGEAEARRKSLDEERSRRMGSGLEPQVVSQYEKLLDSREGQAMAELDGRICQGCYVNVPNNVYVRLARATEIVSCPSCGRILYLPD